MLCPSIRKVPFDSTEMSACHFVSCNSTFYLSLLSHIKTLPSNIHQAFNSFLLDWFCRYCSSFIPCIISLPHKTVQPLCFSTNIFIHHFSSFVPLQFIGELLREGAALSVGITAARGHGGQWLARVHQAISDGLVPDVRIVPVGVSYDCLPRHFIRPQVTTLILTMHTPLHNDPIVTISAWGC